MKNTVIKISVFAVLIILAFSCTNRRSNHTVENNYILGFRIKKPNTPNPDAVVFHIHVDNELLTEVLDFQKWDNIQFSGGIFDTVDYNEYSIGVGVGETDVQNELLMAASIFGFKNYNQKEMDSISILSFKDVEINIWYKDEKWTLKPLEDSIPDWSYLNKLNGL